MVLVMGDERVRRRVGPGARRTDPLRALRQCGQREGRPRPASDRAGRDGARSRFGGSSCAYSDGRLIVPVLPLEGGPRGRLPGAGRAGRTRVHLRTCRRGAPVVLSERRRLPRRGDQRCRRPPRTPYLPGCGRQCARVVEAGRAASPTLPGLRVLPEGRRRWDGGDGLRRATSAVRRRPACNGDDVVGGASILRTAPRIGDRGCAAPSSENPHGGANKNLAGLYSVGSGKWLVPLGRGFAGRLRRRQRRHAVGYVTAQTTGEGADAAGGAAAASERRSGWRPIRAPALCARPCMDAEGDVVFDAATHGRMRPSASPQDF